MKRLIITGPCEARFEEAPLPACPSHGIVVRAVLTAISPGTELRVYRAVPVDAGGRFLHERVPFVLPTTNGYSMVGEVVEAGPQATGFSPGQRVFVPAPHQEFAAVPAALAVPLPDEIPNDRAVFLNILEVGHIALRRGRPEPGANVAIVGQGVIGLSVLAFCRAFGFRTAVIEPDDGRRDIALRMGADLAVSPAEEGFAQRIAGHFDGEGPDLVVEAGSGWSALRVALEVARDDGRVVIASRHTGVPDFNPVGHPFLGKRLELLTSYGHEPDGRRWDRRRSFALTVRLLREGRLVIDPMITHRFAWHELPEVYRRMHEGDRTIVGAVLRWGTAES
jgi:threonine dehydrogenase-like Zn-dependent dehydrogenase